MYCLSGMQRCSWSTCALARSTKALIRNGCASGPPTHRMWGLSWRQHCLWSRSNRLCCWQACTCFRSMGLSWRQAFCRYLSGHLSCRMPCIIIILTEYSRGYCLCQNPRHCFRTCRDALTVWHPCWAAQRCTDSSHQMKAHSRDRDSQGGRTADSNTPGETGS